RAAVPTQILSSQTLLAPPILRVWVMPINRVAAFLPVLPSSSRSYRPCRREYKKDELPAGNRFAALLPFLPKMNSQSSISLRRFSSQSSVDGISHGFQ